MDPITESGKKALKELHIILKELQKKSYVSLQKGDLLMLNNRTSGHARSSLRQMRIRRREDGYREIIQLTKINYFM